jgi:cell division protein FtsW (lipid II flippase)
MAKKSSVVLKNIKKNDKESVEVKVHAKQTKVITSDKKPISILAIVALVVSLIVFIAPFAQIIAIILAIIALLQISKTNQRGKGLAVSAIVVSIVLIITVIIAVFFMIGPLFEMQKCKNMDCCMTLNSTFMGADSKEVCILLNVGNYSKTNVNVDWKICEKYMTTNDSLNLCSAFLYHEPSYCQKIVDYQTRIECMKTK